MKYINFSDEDFHRANTINLAAYLQSRGERLKKVGSTYQYIYSDGSGMHDSVTIYENKWYDHKNQRGGYAVKFLQEFFNMSFQESMLELLGGSCSELTHASPKEYKPKPFELPEANDNIRRVMAYLTKQRYIAPEVVSDFVREKKIYESKKYHNAVFVGTDENGTPRQAHARSTITFGKPFRITVAGSDTRYSFSHFGVSDRLYVFEAPIDMLSFITLYPKDWQQHSYIAMNGVYESAMLTALENHSELKRIYLCTDNDEGGIEAACRLSDILEQHGYTDIARLEPTQKDWNEVLKERNGAEYLPAVLHKRWELYLQTADELEPVSIDRNRLSSQLSGIYQSGNYIRLAAFCLSTAEHFSKIGGSGVGFDRFRESLKTAYKPYADKGGVSVKAKKLCSFVRTTYSQLSKHTLTAEQMRNTAQLLCETADHALRLNEEETLSQDTGQAETPEETPRAFNISMG